MVAPVFSGTFVSIEEGVVFYPLNRSWICVLFKKVYCGIEEWLIIHVSTKLGDGFLSFLGYEEFYEGNGIVEIQVGISG